MSESMVSVAGGHIQFGDAVSRIADSLSPLGAAARVVAESYALVAEMRRINLEKSQAADDKEFRLALLERRRQESSATLRHKQQELGHADVTAQAMRECMVNMQRETVKPGLDLEHEIRDSCGQAGRQWFADLEQRVEQARSERRASRRS